MAPRSPTGGIPVSEYQQYVGNGNGVWKAIATGLGGLVVGLLLAWFTAFMGKGVSLREMEDYTKDHSPYAYDKQVLVEHNASQDTKIGNLEGKQERTNDRIAKIESLQNEHDRQITDLRNDMKTKMDIVASMLENQKSKK